MLAEAGIECKTTAMAAHHSRVKYHSHPRQAKPNDISICFCLTIDPAVEPNVLSASNIRFVKVKIPEMSSRDETDYKFNGVTELGIGPSLLLSRAPWRNHLPFMVC
jgi:hypothetical protein